MSTALVKDRQKRIQLMRNIAKAQNEEWIPKKWFISMFCINSGVRQRLAIEYFDIWVNFGAFEENETKTEFRVVPETKQD